MNTLITNEIYVHLFDSIVALIVIAIMGIIILLFASRRAEGNRKKRQLKIRTLYLCVILFLFVMARIWIEGFTHLLAILGLVSAALLIVNKETIMNFVGWMIINWRNLFIEGDLIVIQHYKGYVRYIGFLYITLSEVSEQGVNHVTGRVIRVPNGLLATNALINLSQTSHLREQQQMIIVTNDSDIISTSKFLRSSAQQIITSCYKDKKEFSIDYLRRRNKHLAEHIDLTPRISIQPIWTKPGGIQFTIYYYCFDCDADKLQQQLLTIILTTVQTQENVTLMQKFD